MTSESKIERLTVGQEAEGERLDRWLAMQLPGHSRSAIQRFVREGCVRINDDVESKPSTTMRAGDRVELQCPPPIPAEPRPQAIDLDIVYEDECLLVLNKPVGLVVHPSPGNREGTLVNALLHHCKGLSTIGGVERPGIVHRLDKLTSGLMIVAKNDRAHRVLARDLSERRIKRTYLAVVWGMPQPPEATIQSQIGRHHRDRTRMAVVQSGGRKAITHFKTRSAAHGLAVLEVSLETGRTHQIRVHMAHAGYPVVGDPQYGLGVKQLASRLAALPPAVRPAVAGADHQFLHATRLSFRHPDSKRNMEFEAAPPGDVERLILALGPDIQKPPGKVPH